MLLSLSVHRVFFCSFLCFILLLLLKHNSLRSFSPFLSLSFFLTLSRSLSFALTLALLLPAQLHVPPFSPLFLFQQHHSHHHQHHLHHLHHLHQHTFSL
ncbi:MAG: hypothetical protein J3R72DRAFT_436249 [Linnemannia gamsii]|nr:MAG: hypothetical protein J3R72DRAFT_436249 [Linnemannia gamsii]